MIPEFIKYVQFNETDTIVLCICYISGQLLNSTLWSAHVQYNNILYVSGQLWFLYVMHLRIGLDCFEQRIKRRAFKFQLFLLLSVLYTQDNNSKLYPLSFVKLMIRWSFRKSVRLLLWSLSPLRCHRKGLTQAWRRLFPIYSYGIINSNTIALYYKYIHCPCRKDWITHNNYWIGSNSYNFYVY